MATDYSIDELLGSMSGWDASDLHLSVGSWPAVRVRGEIHPVEDLPPLTDEETHELLYRILSTEQQKRLEIERQIDVSYSVPGVARFRLIPKEIKSLEELGLPDTLHELAERPRGLVLVTGPTGSGKSTTLASLIDEVNRTR